MEEIIAVSYDHFNPSVYENFICDNEIIRQQKINQYIFVSLAIFIGVVILYLILKHVEN